MTCLQLCATPPPRQRAQLLMSTRCDDVDATPADAPSCAGGRTRRHRRCAHIPSSPRRAAPSAPPPPRRRPSACTATSTATSGRATRRPACCSCVYASSARARRRPALGRPGVREARRARDGRRPRRAAGSGGRAARRLGRADTGGLPPVPAEALAAYCGVRTPRRPWVPGARAPPAGLVDAAERCILAETRAHARATRARATIAAVNAS